MKALFDCRNLNIRPGEVVLFMANGKHKVITAGRRKTEVKEEGKPNGSTAAKS
jgi:hypothetical protein